MSKETEALKLAMEALEDISALQNHSDSANSSDIDQAITALREALALVNFVDQEESSGTEQPAQPQQEPVEFLDWYDNAHWGNEDFKAGCWRAWNAALKHTSPPNVPTARASKPLTNEEIENVWERVQANDFHDCVQPFARAIEAAHGIKGDA